MKFFSFISFRYYRANSVRHANGPCEGVCALNHYCAITRVDYREFRQCLESAASALASSSKSSESTLSHATFYLSVLLAIFRCNHRKLLLEWLHFMFDVKLIAIQILKCVIKNVFHCLYYKSLKSFRKITIQSHTKVKHTTVVMHLSDYLIKLGIKTRCPVTVRLYTGLVLIEIFNLFKKLLHYICYCRNLVFHSNKLCSNINKINNNNNNNNLNNENNNKNYNYKINRINNDTNKVHHSLNMSKSFYLISLLIILKHLSKSTTTKTTTTTTTTTINCQNTQALYYNKNNNKNVTVGISGNGLLSTITYSASSHTKLNSSSKYYEQHSCNILDNCKLLL